MTTKPVLLLDMDGPLANLDGFLWEVCRVLGIELDIDSLEDPKRKYYITENMPKERDRNAIRKLMDKTHIFEKLYPTNGAIEGTHQLMEYFDVWICTKPLDANPFCRDDKMSWIKRYLPELSGKVIMAPKKSLVVGDILLDDAPSNLCVPYATWQPVVFRDTFNQNDPFWSSLPSWSWGDSIEDLLKHVDPKKHELVDMVFTD